MSTGVAKKDDTVRNMIGSSPCTQLLKTGDAQDLKMIELLVVKYRPELEDVDPFFAKNMYQMVEWLRAYCPAPGRSYIVTLANIEAMVQCIKTINFPKTGGKASGSMLKYPEGARRLFRNKYKSRVDLQKLFGLQCVCCCLPGLSVDVGYDVSAERFVPAPV